MKRHVLDSVCRRCGEQLTWGVIRYYRPDGYFDWRLDVACGCGAVQDPEMLKAAGKAHDAQVTAKIAEEQKRSLGKLDQILESWENTLLDETM